MLLLRANRYNLLLKAFMSRQEMDSLLGSKYSLTSSIKSKPPMLKPSKEEISLLLKSKYSLSLVQKHKDKQKDAKKEEAPQIKFEVKPPKGTRDFYPDQMAIRRKVIDTVADVFKKHGAVEIDTPVFELKEVLTGKYGEDSKLIYDLQDQGGEICSLRYDLTVPFARFMANNTNIQKIKRFHIGKVYRRDQPAIARGRYRQFYQCDFDIAGKYDAMIPDAEVLAIMQEILQTLGVSDFLVKVNHRKILQAMVSEAGCNPEMFKTICSSIDKLDKQPWCQVQAELQTKGATKEQCKIMEKLTALKGDPLELWKDLNQNDYFKKEKANLSDTMKDMEKLFTYLRAMERIGKVSFDLSLARGLDYYTGIIYQIVLTDKTTELGSISGGGRYDNLIGMFCQHQIPAVGGSMGIQRLFNILQITYKNKIKKNACQVLVGTIKQIPVETKMGVLAKLWKAGIKAETMYVQKANSAKHFSYAFDNEIPIILWLAEDELNSGQVKIRILYKKEEHNIKLDNLEQNIRPFLQAFKKDYEEGKVSFEDPNKQPKK